MVRPTLLAALVGAASASMVIPHHHAVRHVVEARQTDDPAWSRCAAALDSVLTDAPRQPFDIAAYNVCGPLPTSLLSAFSSYSEAVQSWDKIHGSAYTSALALCPTAPVSGIPPSTCTLTEFLGSGAPTTIVTPTSTPNADANAGKNTGHRETGIAWAAGAIAGFFGIAAIL